ncbi:MAG: hypothetical protein GWN58_13545, partial [Anaerolineae bacterium]|nr:hypothetical protein [Anaerolineae bacterium]
MAKKYSKRVIETPLADVAPEDREEHITLVREQIVKLAQSAQISLDGVRASVHEMGPLFDYLKEEQRKGYIGREFS